MDAVGVAVTTLWRSVKSMASEPEIQQPIVLEYDDKFLAQIFEWAAAAGRTPGDWVGDVIEETMRERMAKNPEQYRS